MAQYPQYYGGTGIPVVIEADPGDPIRAWTSQRARLRSWVDALDEDGWGGPTRCPAWNTRGLVQHLASGAAFLGYSLHQAMKGEATEYLTGLDTHITVEAAAAGLDGMSLEELVTSLHHSDASVEREAARHAEADWQPLAEAPPGHMPGHLAISHFAWDSWVHEYDLLLPVGQRPELVPLEAEVAARYLFALATAQHGPDVQLEVRLTDLDVVIGYEGDGTVVHVRPGQGVPGAPVVEGAVLDVCDRATGREPAGPVTGDDVAMRIVDQMAALLK